MRSKFILAAALCAIAVPAPAMAGAVVSGFNSSQFPPIDDGFLSGGMGFNANFFGQTYSTAYVSSNGYITFGAGSSTYTPTGLGAAYVGLPIIAAFFADVDTQGAGDNDIAFGTGVFNGRNAFGATWPGVGYYDNSTDKLNNFQLLLVERGDTGAGNFDIVFNYDSIQWESGDVESPGDNGLGGNSAAVGYNAGTGNQPGTYFQFAGSQTPGAFLNGGSNALATNSNVGVAGRYVFNVRNGTVTPEPGAVPEPGTWALLILGFGAVGGAMRRRAAVAKVSRMRLTYA